MRYDFEDKHGFNITITTVNIARPGIVSDDEHESETALDSFAYDMEIINDGDLESLEHKAIQFVSTLIKKKSS